MARHGSAAVTSRGGDVPPVRAEAHRAWRNWAGTERCTPAVTFWPSTPEELVAVVRHARDRGATLRVVGAGHSWSALVPTDDVLVCTDRLDRVHLDLDDPVGPLVWAEAGATVRQVNDVLEPSGFALPFNVVLESVRMCGLVATGSHGSGWQHQTLSDQVHALDVVTSAGTVRRFTCGIDDEETMAAARLALGAFGVIWRVALRAEPTYRVRAVDRRLPIGAVLESMAEEVPRHDNLDLFWWPFTDEMWVKTWDRCEGEPTAKPRSSRRERLGSHISAHLYDAALATMKRAPRLVPALSRAAFRFTPSEGDRVVDVVEAVHYRRAIEVTPLGCVEVAFKIDGSFGNVRAAIEAVFDATRHAAAAGHYPFNVTMNVRFIHNSDCLLSPASGPGHTCFIEVLSRAPARDWLPFSGALGARWLELPKARPHWAKEYRHIPGVLDAVRAAYGDDLARFAAARDRAGVDPERMFVNRMLAELLP